MEHAGKKRLDEVGLTMGAAMRTVMMMRGRMRSVCMIVSKTERQPDSFDMGRWWICGHRHLRPRAGRAPR